MRAGLILLTALLALGGAGCGRGSGQSALTWAELVRQLADWDRVSRLVTPSAALVSSADPAGGNDDFNHFLRPGCEPGWAVLADLKGPGYVSRFWMTGPPSGDWPLRFYFDGEKTPRLDITLGELCGGREPFRPPLAARDNYCWYCFVPLPYRKRLVIETRAGGQKPGGWPRVFYQVNYATLPRACGVESLPRKFSASDLEAVRQVRAAWQNPPAARAWPSPPAVAVTLALPPGGGAEALRLAGPALIRQLRFTPDFGALRSPAQREQVLRDLVLRIRWNDCGADSVVAPLGDFCGSVWQRTRYQSAYFGLANDTFVNAFPMPFEHGAVVRLENQGAQPLGVRVEAEVERLAAWDPALGYFHSGWQRTGLEDVGRPHAVLRTRGRGHYAGCLLAVCSLDRSYWILEGDEFIRRDREDVAGWRGTGLEDYFNGGWYYQNVMTFPLHGLPFKAPFRTVQYMLHPSTPVRFDSSCDLVFERGPDHASRGWLESQSFYYLAAPTAAFARLGVAADRRPPEDPPLSRATLMTEIWNYERFGDHRGASEFIDRYLQRHPDFPFAAILRLRQSAYRERELGFEAARAEYEQAASAPGGGPASQFAKLLLWLRQSPSNALLGAYANMRTQVWLDGEPALEAGDPERLAVRAVGLAPGRHVLAVACEWHAYPDWVQVLLRTGRGDVLSSPDWIRALNPPAGWEKLEYDDRFWTPVGVATKGPPEEPHIWVMPDVFVDWQSRAAGLRPELDWPERQGRVVYRRVFELP